MTSMTQFRDLRIGAKQDPQGGIMLVACGEQLFYNCLLENVQILISNDCKEGCFRYCTLIACKIVLQEKGPGASAFTGCHFDDATTWEEEFKHDQH